MNGPLLDADLREAARILVATGRLRAETAPEAYRAAVKGRQQLTAFFHEELAWNVEVLEVAEMVRLHKRRVDVPADRGPTLVRGRGDGRLASREVLVCVALVCEQLWRRSRMSLRELLQALAQVCAAEAAEGTLPRFQVVAPDGVGKQAARENRRQLVDALKLLVAEGTVVVDADLDHAMDAEDGDLVVSASRDRLAAKFSSLSPVLLGLDKLPPDRHAAALSAASLPEHEATTDPARTPTLEDRRLRLARRLVDDPATDPADDRTEGSPYLHTLTGRERALNVTGSLGYTATVRRDWWEITDPSGVGTAIEFPNGRRTERQAALALLGALSGRVDRTAPLPISEVVEVMERARRELPRWAAAYAERLPALARAATAELAAVGLLRPAPEDVDVWLPTPGVHLWRIKVRHGSQAKTPKSPSAADQAALPLTDTPGSTP
ncbi:DUF2398 family protein [Spirillospora sp. NPDC029432]|uniref:DUF2398 family protein n=1 Tax=Spirillospora sp. NPDC029432 TaxID=3154599 RepID=UPI0034559B01